LRRKWNRENAINYTTVWLQNWVSAWGAHQKLGPTLIEKTKARGGGEEFNFKEPYTTKGRGASQNLKEDQKTKNGPNTAIQND